jgi:hypothetical protein
VLAVATLSASGNPYDTNPSDGDTDCSTEINTNADGDNIECWSALGPIHALSKPCLKDDVPCFMAPTTTPGIAVFDMSAFPASGTVDVSVWAEWTSGKFQTGFDLAVCNDRDLNGWCRNIGDATDQLRFAYSNKPVPGADCKGQDKDAKDCPDPTDAEFTHFFCMVPANPSAPAPWTQGQIVAFIGNWGSSIPGNVGGGASSGTYDVWMKVNGTGCVPPVCDDKADNDMDGAVDINDVGCLDYEDGSE